MTKEFPKTKFQTNLIWFRTIGLLRCIGGIAKLDAKCEQFAWQIFNRFFWEMFSGSNGSMNFEEIINFVELSAISYLTFVAAISYLMFECFYLSSAFNLLWAFFSTLSLFSFLFSNMILHISFGRKLSRFFLMKTNSTKSRF